MGIGKSKFAAVVGALAVLFCSQQPSEARERNTGIWRVLRAGHFSGPMNDGAHVRAIKGVIEAQGKRYKFWEYEWLNKENGHGGDALLVFESTGNALTYLGSYTFDAYPFHGRIHPQIRGKVVFFPYKDIEIMGVKFNKELSFENGPPAEAKIQGGSEFLRE